MTIVRTITKNVLSRAWYDIDPKLIAATTTGVSASAVVEVGQLVGYHVSAPLALLVSSVLGAVIGYIKSSTVKVQPAKAVAALAAATAPAPAPAPVDAAPVAPALPANSVPATSGL